MPEEVLLSALNHYLYCDRRAALIHIEGIFRQNASTVEGSLRHEAADTPGYENRPGVRVLRALPVFSLTLGLSGTADIVEFHQGVPYPVEYKRGKRRAWDNDDVQLCGQALCLEEMFEREVPAGAIFHASSRRRREVAFGAGLRRQTLQAVQDLRRLLENQQLPPTRVKPQCDGCSLRPDCLPELDDRAVRSAGGRLFRTEP